jgi:hypothetical protein
MYGTVGKHQSHSFGNADRVFIELRFCTKSVTFVDSRFLSIFMVFVLRLYLAFNMYYRGYRCGSGFLIFVFIKRLYFICSVTIKSSS